MQAAFERIDAFAARQLMIDATPGISLAITDQDGLLHSSAHGYADLAARTPLTPQHMSEFGSIGKSFTAIICLQLSEDGRLDLHAPVVKYLPWFEVQSRHAPITTHHLLTHSGGLVNGTDFTPGQRFEVWALRETEAVAAPGERFRYSNVGYKSLGLMLERITGQTYRQLVEERILAPLGMRDTHAAITHATRERLMVGYGWFYDDRPQRRGARLAPATWLETDTADGCIASTPTDLAIYLRMLMNGGAAPSGRVLSEAAFERMTTRYIDLGHGRQTPSGGEEMSYSYGLYVMDTGRLLIGHGGGMVGYYSDMLADFDTGFGVTVFINGPGNQDAVARFALDTLAAASRGEALPELPELTDPAVIENAGEYAGSYTAATGTLEIRANSNRLRLRHDAEWLALSRLGSEAFLVEHPDFALFPLRFSRDDAGAVTEALHGERWWRSPAYAGPTEFEVPAEWRAYTGHYRSYDPWFTNFRVLLRKGELRLAEPGGSEQMLTPLGDASFRISADPLASDFVSFDTVVEGEALRANYCGCHYYRFFTP